MILKWILETEKSQRVDWISAIQDSATGTGVNLMKCQLP